MFLGCITDICAVEVVVVKVQIDRKKAKKEKFQRTGNQTAQGKFNLVD